MPRKLLLADDSTTIQRVIELTFSREDVQVVVVGDGEQAIARIPVERPDVVLADIGMPKRSGYDVAAFVKGHPDLKHIPVLLLAGAFEPVDEAKAEQAGCDGVLVKPFEPRHVIARVRELLDGVKGSSTQPAVPHVARPVERLTRGAGSGTRDPEGGSQDRSNAASHVAPSQPGSGIADPGSQIPNSGSRIQDPGSTVAGASLDDYFDRLDAAFSTMGSGTPAAPIDTADPDVNLVPTLDAVLGKPAVQPPPIEPPEASATLTPGPAESLRGPVESSGPIPPQPPPPAASAPAAHTLADAFSKLLAVEQGEPGAVAPRLTLTTQEAVVTDALVDEVARRVLAKLAPDAAREVVVEVVSEVAERLVREEIARIRGK